MAAESQSDATATQAEASAKTTSDINTAEAQDAGVYTATRSWDANTKRMFDEYMALSLETARRSRDRFDALMSDARTHISDVNALIIDKLSNATAVSNGENQRTVRHGDVAADRIWNLDEAALALKEILTEDQPFKDAISAQVISSIAAMAKDTK